VVGCCLLSLSGWLLVVLWWFAVGCPLVVGYWLFFDGWLLGYG